MPSSLPVTRISFPGTPGLLLAFGFSCCTSLLAATASAWCYPASAQTATPGLQQPSGIDATSPLSLGSGPVIPRVGVPLGSTEVATPGISPAAPLSGAGSILGNTSCSGFSNLTQSPGAPFDGGGISVNTAVPCAPKGSGCLGSCHVAFVHRARQDSPRIDRTGRSRPQPHGPGSRSARIPARFISSNWRGPLPASQFLFAGDRRFRRLLN
jgi:hypothetical protein